MVCAALWRGSGVSVIAGGFKVNLWNNDERQICGITTGLLLCSHLSVQHK